MFTRFVILLSICFFSNSSFAMPNEVTDYSKKAFKLLAKQDSFRKKWAVFNNYKTQIKSMKKTMKTEMDLIEYYGLTMALNEFKPDLLRAKKCTSIKDNLKSKFYPRGVASKDGPNHYKYAIKFLRGFCK